MSSMAGDLQRAMERIERLAVAAIERNHVYDRYTNPLVEALGQIRDLAEGWSDVEHY